MITAEVSLSHAGFLVCSPTFVYVSYGLLDTWGLKYFSLFLSIVFYLFQLKHVFTSHSKRFGVLDIWSPIPRETPRLSFRISPAQKSDLSPLVTTTMATELYTTTPTQVASLTHYVVLLTICNYYLIVSNLLYI